MYTGHLCHRSLFKFSEFWFSVGDWKLTKMAACKLHFSFRRFVVIISTGFLEAIKRNVENSVLVCFKVLDVYFPAVFMVGKKVSTPGMTTLDHVTTVSSFLKVNLSLSLYFLP